MDLRVELSMETQIELGPQDACAENGFRVELSMESHDGEDSHAYGPMKHPDDSQKMDLR